MTDTKEKDAQKKIAHLKEEIVELGFLVEETESGEIKISAPEK